MAMDKNAFKQVAAVSLLLFSLVAGLNLSIAETGTQVSGVISQDTTWTIRNNPYYFTGDATIQKGTTLTIESGVTVEFSKATTASDQYGRPYEVDHTYNLKIDGSVRVNGASFNVVAENGANGHQASQLTFSNSSSNSSLQNVIFSGDFTIITFSPDLQFHNNRGQLSIQISGGSPTIDNSTLSQVSVGEGSPVISNNNLESITVYTGSPIISNNTIEGGQNYGISLDNSQEDTGAVISDNHILGSFTNGGIIVAAGTPTIARNFIRAGTVGITVNGNSGPLIENNTIVENNIGLNIYNSNGSPSPTITNNNFEQNSQYNIYLGQQGVYETTAPNINAANNWWGTIDEPTINQTIYDFKNNYRLGAVTFTPVLTAPNPQATPNPNLPIQTPIPSQTPIPASTPMSSPGPTSSATPLPSPTIPEFPSWLILPFLAAATVFGAVLIRRRKAAALIEEKLLCILTKSGTQQLPALNGFCVNVSLQTSF